MGHNTSSSLAVASPQMASLVSHDDGDPPPDDMRPRKVTPGERFALKDHVGAIANIDSNGSADDDESCCDNEEFIHQIVITASGGNPQDVILELENDEVHQYIKQLIGGDKVDDLFVDSVNMLEGYVRKKTYQVTDFTDPNPGNHHVAFVNFDHFQSDVDGGSWGMFNTHYPDAGETYLEPPFIIDVPNGQPLYGVYPVYLHHPPNIVGSSNGSLQNSSVAASDTGQREVTPLAETHNRQRGVTP